MRARALPDLHAKISDSEGGRLAREFMCETLNTKGDWLDYYLKKHLPADIYSMAHDYSAPYEAFEHRQEVVKKWMDSHDFRIEEHGLNARLFIGNRLISQFFVKLVDE